MTDFKKYIPFEEKKFRPYQEGAIKDILKSIEDGNKFTILDAPVGSGKSLVSYVIAKYFEEKGLSSYMCTGTKILQSQYINDFKDVKTIKGRGNFQCYTEPLVDCANGMCQSHANFRCSSKPVLKGTWGFEGNPLPSEPIEINGKRCFYGDPDFDKIFTKNMCPYWKQKINGIMAPITMLNYDYLISDISFVQHLPHRKVLIADEAHNLEQILMRQLETSFSPRVVLRDTGLKIKEYTSITKWIEQIESIADLYLGKMKTASDDVKKKKMEKRFFKFSELLALIEEDPSNWVFVKDTKTKNTIYTFKPITVSRYSKLVFSIADHIVLMTGTVLKQDIFARDLGIDDFSYIEIPSIIPPENRPIIKMYAGSMSRSSIDKTMKNMIATIKMLAKKHNNEKGLISTYTYAISNKFKEALGSDERFMFHNSEDKEATFNEFKADKTNKILVSPVAIEGVDFAGDQARFHLITKDPFPNLGDKQLSTRDSIDYGYIFRDRCRVLSQLYGRCVRGSTDYAVTYLLDNRLESLLGPSSLVTDYFLEALDGLRYNDKLILEEDAYEKLTKDNARKNHDFEREVEKNVLKDIEDGYNSLYALRKAYKEFPSDAYKYISPAVERLLKNGAIRYA